MTHPLETQSLVGIIGRLVDYASGATVSREIGLPNPRNCLCAPTVDQIAPVSCESDSVHHSFLDAGLTIDSCRSEVSS